MKAQAMCMLMLIKHIEARVQRLKLPNLSLNAEGRAVTRGPGFEGASRIDLEVAALLVAYQSRGLRPNVLQCLQKFRVRRCSIGPVP